jgi:N4-bis(aminopropyl)spermidine synthase
MVVIADDAELEWPQRVLANVQGFALDSGFFVQRMMSKLHLYHLDDAPDLKSCNLLLKALPGNNSSEPSRAIRDPERLRDFYGKGRVPEVRYVIEKKRLDYGKAREDEYSFELLREADGRHY